jgi:hypothetical protein
MHQGHAPANMLMKHRYLVRAVKTKLGTHMLSPQLYNMYWPEWKQLDTIHLLINHRSYLDKNSPIKEFNAENIATYNYTYGEMCRDILQRIQPYVLDQKRSFLSF